MEIGLQVGLGLVAAERDAVEAAKEKEVVERVDCRTHPKSKIALGEHPGFQQKRFWAKLDILSSTKNWRWTHLASDAGEMGPKV